MDLGSGGGFPGLVIGCALAERDGACVHLIESSTKKAAFLREVARETGAPVIVHAERIEKVGPRLRPVADVITARALAPLGKLCHLVAPISQKRRTRFVDERSRFRGSELTEATRYWNIDFNLVASRTDPAGRIMIVRALSAEISQCGGHDGQWPVWIIASRRRTGRSGDRLVPAYVFLLSPTRKAGSEKPPPPSISALRSRRSAKPCWLSISIPRAMPPRVSASIVPTGVSPPIT